MDLLSIYEPPKYYEADEELVRRALHGHVTPEGLPRCIRSHVVQWEEVIKVVEIVDKIPHEVQKKVRHKERYYPDHRSRVNWGALYRACRRLVDCGVLLSFTLRHNGDLSVVWFKAKGKTEYKPVVKYVPPPIISTIGAAERMMDKRLEFEHGEMYQKTDTTPKQYYDLEGEPRDIVEARVRQNALSIHSEEARIERIADKKSRDIPSYLRNLQGKIKYSNVLSGPVHRDTTPLYTKIARIRMEKGCCSWPNGYNKLL